MYCSKCGTQVTDKTLSCSNCGARLARRSWLGGVLLTVIALALLVAGGIGVQSGLLPDSTRHLSALE
jgi:zinc ribbon protein